MAGLVCPHCGVSTAFNPARVRGIGVLLERSRPDVMYKEEVQIPAVLKGPDVDPNVAVVECTECRHVFIASTSNSWSEDWHTVWPVVTTAVPVEIPEPVRSAMAEALLCLGSGALGGCLLMCRTVIIRLQREQKAGSLDELKDRGTISRLLHQQANEVRLWANIVGHEDYSPDTISAESCEELVEYVDSLLDAVYVQPARLASHQARRKQAK